MSGNAEAKLGDLIQTIESRFFLFEVKALRSDIKAEWVEKDRGEQKEFRTKRAYQVLMALAARSTDQESSRPTAALNVLFRSSLCHHFVYWDDRSTSGGVHPLRIEPYILAVTDEPSRPYQEEIVRLSIQEQLRLAILDNSVDPEQILACTSVSLRALASQSVGVSYRNRWIQMGLKAQEFQRYLGLLCQGEHEEVDLVAMNFGGFVRIINNTGELVALVEALRLAQERGGIDAVKHDDYTFGEEMESSRVASDRAMQTHFEVQELSWMALQKMELPITPKAGANDLS
ncbi:hypothetical protein XcyCFBP4188_08895 [Xanthomonas hortorum pv. cynarae]|nr:hypothetical protein XcyCFBP4188_08895 [Xanthomonas hortorum pv. cynarae]